MAPEAGFKRDRKRPERRVVLIYRADILSAIRQHPHPTQLRYVRDLSGNGTEHG